MPRKRNAYGFLSLISFSSPSARTSRIEYACPQAIAELADSLVCVQTHVILLQADILVELLIGRGAAARCAHQEVGRAE